MENEKQKKSIRKEEDVDKVEADKIEVSPSADKDLLEVLAELFPTAAVARVDKLEDEDAQTFG